MSETLEFNQIVLPYVHVRDPERAAELIRAARPEHRALYETLNDVFPPGGQLDRCTRSGNFEDLQGLAAKNAAEVARRSPVELSLPATFAVHGVASFIVSMHRPTEVPHCDDRSTYFLTQFATRLALQPSERQLHSGPDPFDFRTAITKRSELLSKAADNPPSWMGSKFLMLADRLMLRKHLLTTIDTEPRIEVDRLEELKEANDTLFAELRRLKRYSIKSAVHETATSAWSIHDGFDLRAQQQELVEVTKSSIRPHEWRPCMVMAAIERPLEEDKEALVMSRPSIEGRPNYEEYGRHVYMDQVGELFGDAYGSMPLAPFYESRDMLGNYEALRQYLIEAYFNLTVPTEIVVQAQQVTRRHATARAKTPDGQPDVVYHDMLLPRIRLLRDFDRADQLDAIDSGEDETAMSSDSARSRRRLHAVGAFPRALPQGYKPSQEALELARKLEINLLDNETLVRAHPRGDAANGVIGYLAKDDGSRP